jgi:uncharacterized protein (TIGR03437 family)
MLAQGHMAILLLLIFLLPCFVLGEVPNITTVVNAAGPPSSTISSNTWVALFGTGLAPDTRPWNNSDFVNGQMPTSLAGVSVNLFDPGSGATVKAFISFVSPTQVNILTPFNLSNSCCLIQIQVPFEGQTAVNCQLANTNLAYSECGYGQVVPASPEFFLWPGTSYIVAEHANGSLIGPIGLGPGSTPAKPGETVVLYANGLGAVSGNIVSGSDVQFAALAVLPQVYVGGSPVTVNFAGVILPGLYQLNIVIPADTPDGDWTVDISIPTNNPLEFWMSADPAVITIVK